MVFNVSVGNWLTLSFAICRKANAIPDMNCDEKKKKAIKKTQSEITLHSTKLRSVDFQYFFFLSSSDSSFTMNKSTNVFQYNSSSFSTKSHSVYNVCQNKITKVFTKVLYYLIIYHFKSYNLYTSMILFIYKK